MPDKIPNNSRHKDYPFRSPAPSDRPLNAYQSPFEKKVRAFIKRIKDKRHNHGQKK
jgi:hypothetical protein